MFAVVAVVAVVCGCLTLFAVVAVVCRCLPLGRRTLRAVAVAALVGSAR